MYEIKKDESRATVELKLTGSITIQNSAEIKNVLLDHYKNVSSLVIDQSGIDSLDISYLQLLISLKKSMQADGKNFKVKGANTAAFSSLLNDSGYAGYDWLADEFEKIPEGKSL